MFLTIHLMKIGGGGDSTKPSFWYINLRAPVWSDSQIDKSKELNHQRSVTVQIASQISEHWIALARET